MGNALLVERLKALRKEKRLYQEDVAKELGIPKTTYASYEQGKSEPSLETVAKLAVYFGVTSDYLLGLANAPDESITPDILQGLPPEAQRDVLQYVEFVRQKYNDG